MEREINVSRIDFHPILKDIENIFWFFLLSIRTLSDFDIQKILRQKNNTQLGYNSFNEMLDKFNKSIKLKIEIKDSNSTSKANILKEMVFIGKAMTIMTYDYLLLSSYNTVINKDTEFRFLKFIRNGAVHNNKFNLKDENGEWKIKEDEVLEWDDLQISRNLQGKKVFNDFMTVFHIFSLAEHFSDRLKLIDKAS